MCGCSTDPSTWLWYRAQGLVCSSESGSALSYYARVAGEYTAEEALPSGVTASDLLSATTYVSAKQTGLAMALSVSISDVNITGVDITDHSSRLPATDRQLSSHVTVRTSFTVNIVGNSSAASLSAVIAGAASATQTRTNTAMAAADWSGEPVIVTPPTLTHLGMGAALSTAGATDAPTPVPVIVGASMGVPTVAATGDPHLQNVLGQRFDLMQAGRHVLVHIPKGAVSESTLLRVDAEAQRLGRSCGDMYFQELNITGRWAEEKYASGLRFRAADVVTEKPEWVQFGRVELKVAHGRTSQGMHYLNFYAKYLDRAGFSVGGLMGEDDHSKEVIPPADCRHARMSLIELA